MAKHWNVVYLDDEELNKLRELFEDALENNKADGTLQNIAASISEALVQDGGWEEE